MTLKEKYDELFNIIDKYKEDFKVVPIYDIKQNVKKHILLDNLHKNYGFNISLEDINFIDGEVFIKLPKWLKYIKCNSEYAFDNGKRSKQDEELLKFTFMHTENSLLTNYSEDEPYLTEFINEQDVKMFFKKMKKVLLLYKPKYTILKEYKFYFNLENGAKVCNEIDKIINEWYNGTKKLRLKAEIGCKQEELKKLK